MNRILAGTAPSRRAKCDSSLNARRALTLFEVVLSLAIFVGSLAAIGQLVSTGVRGALVARLQTQAVLRCESKLAELISGAELLAATAATPYEDDPAWVWTVDLSAGPQEDLYVVEVTAEHQSSGTLGSVSFTLRRLVRDPQVALQSLQTQQQTGGSQTGNTGRGTVFGGAAGGSRGAGGGSR